MQTSTRVESMMSRRLSPGFKLAAWALLSQIALCVEWPP